MLRREIILATVAACGLWAGDARAQTGSLFGSSGPVSQSGRSTATGSSSAGQSASSALSQSAGTTGNRGATGAQGGQSAGRGASGAGGIAGPQLNQFGSLSANAQNRSGFAGMGNTGQFVGNANAGRQAGGAQPQFSGLGGGRNANVQNPSESSGTTRRQVRPQYRIAFDVNPTPPAEVSKTLDVELTRLTDTTPFAEDVTVRIDQAGMVEITGNAASYDQSRLIENIIRLEPGVRGVKNLLIVPDAPAP